MIQFIDDPGYECGVEPVCRHLPVAPQTYYAARTRDPSLRLVTDEGPTKRIYEIHTSNYGVYGVWKVHAELCREGRQVALCTVWRLMKKEGLRGIRRAKGPRMTIPGPLVDRPADLVKRRFTATAPDCHWVADITYIRTFSGWVYAAFVIDVFARRVVGWQLSTSLHTDLALDALEIGIWDRQGHPIQPQQLRAHSDAGSQYVSLAYTEKLALDGIAPSIGSIGDAYDCQSVSAWFRKNRVVLAGTV